MAIDPQVLRHRQPLRQRHVGRREIHPRQRGETVARHVVAEHLDGARRSGSAGPSSMAIVVVLPAPLPPSRPTVAPAGTAKPMSSTARVSAVALGQVLHPDGVHGGGIVPLPARAKGSDWRYCAWLPRLCAHDRFHPGPRSLPPGQRVYAIGDVHGCLDRLEALHALIAEDLAARPAARPLWCISATMSIAARTAPAWWRCSPPASAGRTCPPST